MLGGPRARGGSARPWLTAGHGVSRGAAPRRCRRPPRRAPRPAPSARPAARGGAPRGRADRAGRRRCAPSSTSARRSTTPPSAASRETPWPRSAPRHPEPPRGPQGRPGIVRHLAGEHELPQRGSAGLLGRRDLLEQVSPEERSVPSAPAAHRDRRPPEMVRRNLAERRRILAEVQRDPVRPCADPDDLAARRQRIEMLGAEARHPARQHLGLPERDRQGECLQRHECFAERRAPVDPVPTGQEPRQRVLPTGSTSRRSAASDARRSRRRTSGSHHSRSVPPGRSSPRRAGRRARARRARRRCPGRIARSACALVNGPRPLA